jgi:hypothetical protein
MQIQIPEIVDRIKEQKCVFLFGPGLAKNKAGESMRSCLVQYFKEKQLGVEEDLDDLYTCDALTKTRALDHLQKYCCDHSEPNDSHRKLALIPCHLYISITPDLLMKQALDDCGVDHEFQYYVKDQTPGEVRKPAGAQPLLYNLFGCIENQRSIIFSQWDIIQYLFSIIKEFKLPQNLREALKKSNYFIFIGFDFDKWYLKLLLRLLLEESKPAIATLEGKPFDEKLKSFYQRRYGLEFVDAHIEEYVRSLYDECRNQGLLREIKEKVRPSIRTEIAELIKQDHVKLALERLIEFMEDDYVLKDRQEDKQEFLQELYIHSGTLNRNERKLRKSLMTEEAANVEQAKICEALLEIAANF